MKICDNISFTFCRPKSKQSCFSVNLFCGAQEQLYWNHFSKRPGVPNMAKANRKYDINTVTSWRLLTCLWFVLQSVPISQGVSHTETPINIKWMECKSRPDSGLIIQWSPSVRLEFCIYGKEIRISYIGQNPKSWMEQVLRNGEKAWK